MNWRAILYQLQAILLLPFVVTVIVPAGILIQASAWPPSVRFGSGSESLVSLLNIALIVVGLALLGITINLLAVQGKGTLAPWTPTRKLVVRGIYRYLRHPMISGVVLILVGEAGLFRASGLLIWALIFLAINLIYLPLIEDRSMEDRFGKAFLDYKKNVPSWVPRATPWKPRN